MILFFAARIYVRSFLMQKLAWDDLTCTIGFLLAVTYYILCLTSVVDGYVGHNSWDVKVGQLGASPFYVVSYLQGIVDSAALLFIKLTFFILYLQIFKPFKYMKIAIWAGAIFNTAFYTILIILTFIFTTPRRGESWEEHLVTKLEEDDVHLSIPQAAVSIVFDFYILILPIYGVWKLQLSRERKIYVSLVFLTGFMACCASILTTYYRVRLQNATNLLNILVPTLTTSEIELEIGLICSCAPVLSQIGRRFKTMGIRGLLSTKGTEGGSYSPNRSVSSFWKRLQNRSGGSDNNYASFDTEVGRDPKDAVESRTYEIELGNRNPVKTFIGSGIAKGSFGNDEDGIHLKHDIVQESINSDN